MNVGDIVVFQHSSWFISDDLSEGSTIVNKGEIGIIVDVVENDGVNFGRVLYVFVSKAIVQAIATCPLKNISSSGCAKVTRTC